MSEEISIGAAAEEDVDYFVERRCRDEQSARLYRDLATQAPNGAQVARDEGTAIGIAIAHALESEWFLSELFVEPSFRGRGIGLQLLKAAAEGAGDVTRSGLLDSNEAAGLAFYAKRGVPLHTPVLRVEGTLPHDSELGRMAAGDQRFSVEDLDPQRHSTALAQLDREIRGSARQLDHAYFAEQGKGYIFARGGELAAYAYVWPSGRVGPLAVTSATYAVQVLGFVLAALRAQFSAQWCSLLVPGTNARVLRACMIAGLQIQGSHIFATDSPVTDLSRYVGFHPLLF